MTEEVSEVVPEAPVETPEVESLVADTQAEASWFYDDNMAGVGDKPEYLKENFKNLGEQARAYVELEKKFGGFKGAPKDGYSMPENISKDDALVQEVIKFGTSHNMSQEGFNEMLDLAMAQAEVTETVSRENEMAKLGDDASKRVSRVDGFLRNNLEAEEYEKIAPLLTTASHVELTEALISMTSQQTLPVDEMVTPEGVTFDSMMKEQMKKDENGNYLMNVDESHRKKVQRMKAQLEALEKRGAS